MKKRRMAVIEEVHVLLDNDPADEDYIIEEDEEEQDQEEHVERKMM